MILSTSTLLPISGHLVGSNHGHKLTNDNIPELQVCRTNDPAWIEGVYGWGPTLGPAGCKLYIFLRHTSPLAVTLLSVVQSPTVETRFWIDFGGDKVPAAPHKFYFNQDDYPLEEVNISDFGRDREIILALVPTSVRRQVSILLHVQTRGNIEHNVHLGYFQYDDNCFPPLGGIG